MDQAQTPALSVPTSTVGCEPSVDPPPAMQAVADGQLRLPPLKPPVIGEVSHIQVPPERVAVAKYGLCVAPVVPPTAMQVVAEVQVRGPKKDELGGRGTGSALENVHAPERSLATV